MNTLWYIIVAVMAVVFWPVTLAFVAGYLVVKLLQNPPQVPPEIR